MSAPIVVPTSHHSYYYEFRKEMDAHKRLLQLQERRETLQMKTGAALQGFFDFDRQHPTPKQMNIWAPIALSFIAGVGAALLSATVPVIVLVAVAGAALGAVLPEPPYQYMNRCLDKYEAYFTPLEADAYSKAANRAVAPVDAGQSQGKSHVAAVEAERAQQRMDAEARTI